MANTIGTGFDKSIAKSPSGRTVGKIMNQPMARMGEVKQFNQKMPSPPLKPKVFPRKSTAVSVRAKNQGG